MALEMRSFCESCHTPVSAGSSKVYICSFERTYCSKCASAQDMKCPGCKGKVASRPVRSKAQLAKFPASTKTSFKGAKAKV